MAEKTEWIVGGCLKVVKTPLRLNPLLTPVFNKKQRGLMVGRGTHDPKIDSSILSVAIEKKK